MLSPPALWHEVDACRSTTCRRVRRPVLGHEHLHVQASTAALGRGLPGSREHCLQKRLLEVSTPCVQHCASRTTAEQRSSPSRKFPTACKTHDITNERDLSADSVWAGHSSCPVRHHRTEWPLPAGALRVRAGLHVVHTFHSRRPVGRSRRHCIVLDLLAG